MADYDHKYFTTLQCYDILVKLKVSAKPVIRQVDNIELILRKVWENKDEKLLPIPLPREY